LEVDPNNPPKEPQSSLLTGKTLTQAQLLPPNYNRSSVIFLGDYIDRGRNSLEVILLLLLYRLCYPTCVFLTRGLIYNDSICFIYLILYHYCVGNHESYRSFDWGLNEELHTKFPLEWPENERIMNHAGRYEYRRPHPLYSKFLELFNSMPMVCTLFDCFEFWNGFMMIRHLWLL
jgi:hypothetical protein